MELCQKLSAAFAQEGITSLNLEDLLSVSFISLFPYPMPMLMSGRYFRRCVKQAIIP